MENFAWCEWVFRSCFERLGEQDYLSAAGTLGLVIKTENKHNPRETAVAAAAAVQLELHLWYPNALKRKRTCNH